MRVLHGLALCVTLALLAVTPPAHAAARANPDKLPVTRIRDLHYGDV